MHLYVHIPFCHRICPYCSFFKHTPASTDMKAFVNALLVELESRMPLIAPPVSGEGHTLYFGGGTPSMLSPTHFTRLVKGIHELIPRNHFREFSFEANPATFTRHKVDTWLEAGMTRVSLGIQSWDESILNILGREHSPEEAKKSFLMLRQAGMRDINIDLMFSIPGQSLPIWKATLERTLELRPEHISAYNLTYEEDTAFFEQLNRGQYTTDEDIDTAFFSLTHDLLTGAGYRHYETSNYARDNRLSQHNLGYWMGDDYIGIGPGAVSTIGRKRIQNTSDTDSYIASTLKNGLPASEIEELNDHDKMLETTALLLRTDTGLPLHLVDQGRMNIVNQLIEEGMAFLTPSKRLVLQGRGLMLVDEIVLELLP